jgi:stage VI sporulation protein D
MEQASSLFEEGGTNVTERQSGLRFDIYERVHLAENTVGVKELDEVELVPHIQVYTEGEQAYLRGNLYLTGTYTGEAGEGSRTLEHLIPVEITLPLNRIQDVDAVSVDIDSFDVDLLSSRSLNVTGVLTLLGIEMLPVPEESWQQEEETVFVSRASQLTAGSASAPEAAEASEQQEEARRARALSQEVVQDAAAADTRADEQPEAETVSEVFVNADDVDEEDESLEVVAAVAEAEEASTAQLIETETAAQQQEEKKELKIAFGSKPAQEPSYHLKSLINKGDVRSQGVETAAEPAQEVQTPKTDALEWKRLFVSGEEGQKFSRVRMCILQKEESLETIAERYNVKPQELLLYNRVSEQELAEGKVLFIPR